MTKCAILGCSSSSQKKGDINHNVSYHGNDEGYLEVAYKRMVEKKTHVSFPQLKYPSLRDEGLRTPVEWLMGKAMDDGAEGLWRVHDGIYDFTTFIDRHPGGEEWLELSKGTDITEAFECHHLNPSVNKLLEKYYMRDAKTPRNSPFTFKEDGFFRTLKREVFEELKKIPAHVANHTNMIIDGLFMSTFISSALSIWLNNYWARQVFYIIAGLSLAWTTVAAHNYIHRKTNWRMYLFNLSMWSYRDFRVSHALSHHLYPNTLMDLEVSAFEPIIWWNPRKDIPWLCHFAVIFEFFLFPFVFTSNFIKRFLLNFTVKGFFKNHYRWHDGVCFTLPLFIYVTTGVSLYEAFVHWFWIVGLSSFIFMNIGSNAAHHHPKIFKDGDEVKNQTPDWGLHEMEAVMDREDINGNLFKVMTFFGDHTLHHLLPTLDHAVLPYLYPVFLKNVEKFRGNFRTTNSFDLFVGQMKMILKTEPSLYKERGLVYE